jgi:hypothetical protein
VSMLNIAGVLCLAIKGHQGVHVGRLVENSRSRQVRRQRKERQRRLGLASGCFSASGFCVESLCGCL